MIAKAPELLPGLEVYYEAFVELSTCRTQGPGPIPWTAIERYADRYGFEDESFYYLVKMIRALDDVFLQHTRNEEKKNQTEQEVSKDARSGRIRQAD